MALVRSEVVGWVSTTFPPIVEVALHGADGEDVRVVDKLVVLSTTSSDESPVDEGTGLPPELWLEADVVAVEGDRSRVLLRHRVETTDDDREIVVRSVDVVES